MNNLSHSLTILWIYSLSFDCLFFKIEIVMTFRLVPHAVPNAFFDGMNTYGTFFYSQRIGRCNTI